jgi:hypothetical protein
MSGNLLMALRTEALATNLYKLKDHLTRIPDRRTDLKSVVDGVTAARNQAKEERKVLHDVKTRLEDMLSDDPLDDAVRRKLQDIAASLSPVVESTEARKNLQNALESLERLRKRCFRLEESAIWPDLQQVLENKTGEALGKVRTLNQQIQRIQPGGDQGPKIWDGLRKATAEQNEKLFAEYIEVLGGVALRDSEFDEGISDVADELLRSYTGQARPPKALTIPGRQQGCLLETFKRIIRVSFPDWSIWALPATALEFWKVIGNEEKLPAIKTAISNLSEKDQALIRPEHWNCLGDAFATYTMGPAFPLMVVTLMLDPQVEADVNHFRTALVMLERMDARRKGEAPYSGIRARLLTEWNSARKQVGKAPLDVNPDDPESDNISDPEGTGLRLLIEIFGRILEAGSAAFTPEIWAEAQKWAPLLVQNRVDKIQIPQGAELRHVLNAAWLARIDPNRPPEIQAEENHVSDKSLTKAVEALRKRLREKK